MVNNKEKEALRDKFAMAAMSALLAINCEESLEYIAGKCYQMADAMLERRKK